MKRLLFWAVVLANAPVAAAPAPVELRVCDDVRDPMTLDPQREFSEKNHTVVQQLFEGLVRFGPKGEIEPALATSWRRMDAKRMRFTLRKNALFHDGTPVNAEAVRFSVARYLDPGTGFPAAGFISTLEKAEVVNEHTVDVITKIPDGLLLNRLAGFVVIVSPQHYGSNSPETLRDLPVGSGPFKIERWDHGKELRLRAFERYWNPDEPKLAGLVFRFVPVEEQADALLSGRIDLVTNLPGTRTLDVQKATGTYVVKAPTFYTVAGNFNVSRKPLSDKSVREAINLAVDRQALVRYDIFGNGTPIATLSQPGEEGHNPRLALYPYDPARAQYLLKEAGYPTGFKLKLLLKANAERTGKIIAKQLEKIGVTLEPTLVTDAELFKYLEDKSKWDIAMYDVPDPMHDSTFIPTIFLAGSSPFSLSVSTAVDAGIAAVVLELDPEKRKRAEQSLDRLIREEHLALPTYQRLRTYGVRKGVTFKPYISGMPYFHEATKTAP